MGSRARTRLPEAIEPKLARDGVPEFDSWLDKQIKSMFDSVLQEPLPEDILELLRRKPKNS